MDNEAIAQQFEELAALLAFQGELPFKIGAYRKAAGIIRRQERPVAQLWQEGSLRQLPGIGEQIEKKIGDLLTTGEIPALTKARAAIPAGLRELILDPAIGPKATRLLHEQLGVNCRADLQQALAAGRLATVAGLTPRTLKCIICPEGQV